MVFLGCLTLIKKYNSIAVVYRYDKLFQNSLRWCKKSILRLSEVCCTSVDLAPHFHCLLNIASTFLLLQFLDLRKTLFRQQ